MAAKSHAIDMQNLAFKSCRAGGVSDLISIFITTENTYALLMRNT